MSSHYDVLGITRKAKAKDVQKAYERKMAALERRPDSLQERVVKDAFSVLSNPVKRADYDSKLGENDLMPAGAGSGSPLIVGIIVVAVTAAGIGFFLTTRDKDQRWMKHEEDRAAAQKAKAKRPSPAESQQPAKR
jgi:DnaJ-class molecular chaperone